MSRASGPRRSSASPDAQAHPDGMTLPPEIVERVRTRLTAIKGWTQMAERNAGAGASSADVEAYLRRSLASIADMESLLDLVAPRESFSPGERVSEPVQGPPGARSYRD